MERKLRVIKDSVVGKPVTKSKGWKLEQKLKLGREQEDYSYPDLFWWRPGPFYTQTPLLSTMYQQGGTEKLQNQEEMNSTFSL